MAQASGFPSPADALGAVAVCLAGFTIPSNSPTPVDLEPSVFIGDYGVGGVIDCCPQPVLRIESGPTGERPAEGLPVTIARHGCVPLVADIVVTFMTCFRTNRKDGTAITNPEELVYNLVILDARWRAVAMLRCCADARIQFLSSAPIPSDGKCAGFEIRLQAPLSLCNPCETPTVSS